MVTSATASSADRGAAWCLGGPTWCLCAGTMWCTVGGRVRWQCKCCKSLLHVPELPRYLAPAGLGRRAVWRAQGGGRPRVQQLRCGVSRRRAAAAVGGQPQLQKPSSSGGLSAARSCCLWCAAAGRHSTGQACPSLGCHCHPGPPISACPPCSYNNVKVPEATNVGIPVGNTPGAQLTSAAVVPPLQSAPLCCSCCRCWSEQQQWCWAELNSCLSPALTPSHTANTRQTLVQAC